MDAKSYTKLYLTISAILGALFGLAFFLIPSIPGGILGVPDIWLYGIPSESYVSLAERFFGATLLAFSIVQWLARNSDGGTAARAILIGTFVGDLLLLLLNAWGWMQGLLNGLAWINSVLLFLLMIGGAHCLMKAKGGSTG